MKTGVKGTDILVLGALLMAGCSTVPTDYSGPPPQADPHTGRPAYWYAQPAAAAVSDPDYDKLWTACEDAARTDLFTLDREDYRQGVLSTKPMISKQFFELWRPDTGDAHGVLQNSLQMIRRTVRFRFEKEGDAYKVTPKVLVERYSEPTRHISSVAEYDQIFNYDTPTVSGNQALQSQAEVRQATDSYWYAIGRDDEMEKQLAQAINDRLH